MKSSSERSSARTPAPLRERWSALRSSWPGIGRLEYESVLSRDYPTIMTLNTIAAVLVLLGNLVADILYAVVDPRIAYD